MNHGTDAGNKLQGAFTRAADLRPFELAFHRAAPHAISRGSSSPSIDSVVARRQTRSGDAHEAFGPCCHCAMGIRERMRTSCRDRMLLLAGLLLAAAPPLRAQSKMYKCIIDGRTIYQQTACPAAQRGSEANPTAAVASAVANSASHVSAKTHAAARSASAASSSPAQAETTGANAKAQH